MSQRSSIEIAIASTIPGASEIFDAVASDADAPSAEPASAYELTVAAAQMNVLTAQNADMVAQLQATSDQQQADIWASLEASGAGLPPLDGAHAGEESDMTAD